MRLYAAIGLYANDFVPVRPSEYARIVYARRLPDEPPLILAQLAPLQESVKAAGPTFNWRRLVDRLVKAGYTVNQATGHPCGRRVLLNGWGKNSVIV